MYIYIYICFRRYNILSSTFQLRFIVSLCRFTKRMLDQRLNHLHTSSPHIFRKGSQNWKIWRRTFLLQRRLGQPKPLKLRMPIRHQSRRRACIRFLYLGLQRIAIVLRAKTTIYDSHGFTISHRFSGIQQITQIRYRQVTPNKKNWYNHQINIICI